MIEQSEIVTSLASANGIYFNIPSLDEYAKKITAHGKSVDFRQPDTGKLIAYALYYDNAPEIFISMVWTHPEYRGRGFAKALLRQIINSSHKDIRLEVHRDNPFRLLYERLGFTVEEEFIGSLYMRFRRKAAIMQPYVFPYIGYFQLIDASDLFVFYDDVHFIKKGWINRNRILLNGRDHLFTVPVADASQNRRINETHLSIDEKWRSAFYKTMTQAYRKAPYFSKVMDQILPIFHAEYESVADMAINSIASVYDYLGMKHSFAKSSVCAPATRELNKSDRLIEITKRHGYKGYVNAASGRHLYSTDYFKTQGVELSYIKSEPIQYTQLADEFVPGLSIIDAMMFNDAETLKTFFGQYSIE